MLKRVVLISPEIEINGPSNLSCVWPAPPLSLLSLGSYLESKKIPVEIIDVQMDFGIGLTSYSARLIRERLANYLASQAMDICWIGISQMSYLSKGLEVAEDIHRLMPKIPIIFGGYLSSIIFEELLKKFSFISGVVIGDGEEAAYQISLALEEGESLPLEKIVNLAWLNGVDVIKNEIQSVSTENLPILNFKLLKKPCCYAYANLMTSRGCPFRCSYCAENSMRRYSAYSADWIGRQLDHVEAVLPNMSIGFLDPIFGVNKKSLSEICKKISGRRFKYFFESRVDVLDCSLIPNLAKSSCEMVYLGIESASQETLFRMNKVVSSEEAYHYLDSAVDIITACFNNGITPILGIMLGFPGDTEDDYKASLAFVQKIETIYNKLFAEFSDGPGFMVWTHDTQVFRGTLLEKAVLDACYFDVRLAQIGFGVMTVLSPSIDVNDKLTKRYCDLIAFHSKANAIAAKRHDRFFWEVNFDEYLNSHPELIDKDMIFSFKDKLLLVNIDSERKRLGEQTEIDKYVSSVKTINIQNPMVKKIWKHIPFKMRAKIKNFIGIR